MSEHCKDEKGCHEVERQRITSLIEGMRKTETLTGETEELLFIHKTARDFYNQALNDLLLKIRDEKKIEIVPSPRIDWCHDCQAEHGYDCPRPATQEEPECRCDCNSYCGCPCHKPRTEETEKVEVEETYDKAGNLKRVVANGVELFSEKEDASFSGLVGCCDECCYYLDYKDDWQCNGGWVSEKCKCHPEIEKDWDYINENRPEKTNTPSESTPQSREQGGENNK